MRRLLFITICKGFESVFWFRDLFDNNVSKYGTTIDILNNKFYFRH